MNPELYEKAKKDFINGYQQYLVSEDVSSLVQNVVIPYFEPLACDLEDLIDEIFNNNEQSNQTLDYIELIFNTKLYDSILLVMKNVFTNNSNQNIYNYSYTHYLIILIEFIKYQKYLIIKQALERINNNSSNSIIQDVLDKATTERAQYCLDKIKSTYLDLVTNYKQLTNCINVTNQLIDENNLTNLISFNN